MQPGARKSEVAGVYRQCVKIRLCAPAVDNKANKALTVFVASVLHVKKSQVVIESGQTARKKLLALNTVAEPDWTGLCTVGNPQ